MKKIIAALVLAAASTSAFAHGGFHGGYGGYHGGYGGYYRGGNNWIGPALIGGIIGYELAQPRVIYQQPPVVVQQQPQVIYQNSTQPMYRYEYIWDASCGCEHQVLVRIN